MIIILAKVFVCSERSPIADAYLPNWHGITPSETNEAEVVQRLGKSNSSTCGGLYQAPLDLIDELELSRQCFCGQSVYYYDAYDTYIYMRSGKVRTISAGSLAFEEAIHLSDLINQYGKPERVVWSRSAPSTDRVVIFTQRGVLAQVRIFQDVKRAGVSAIYYFEPMTLTDTLNTFRNELSTDPQYVHLREAGDIIPGPMDPWGFNN